MTSGGVAEDGSGSRDPARSHPGTVHAREMTRENRMRLPDGRMETLRRAGGPGGQAASVPGICAALAPTDRVHSLARLLDDLDRELGRVDLDDLAWADQALSVT